MLARITISSVRCGHCGQASDNYVQANSTGTCSDSCTHVGPPLTLIGLLMIIRLQIIMRCYN